MCFYLDRFFRLEYRTDRCNRLNQPSVTDHFGLGSGTNFTLTDQFGSVTEPWPPLIITIIIIISGSGSGSGSSITVVVVSYFIWKVNNLI